MGNMPQWAKWLDAIVDQEIKLGQLKSEHMNNCKEPRARIAAVYKEVRQADENLMAFRTFVKNHLSDRRCDQRIAELEPDDAEAYETIANALGDYASTELGDAALKKAKAKEKKESALNMLAGG